MGGELDHLMAAPERDEQAPARLIDPDAIRATGHVVAPRRRDAVAHREDQQGVAARVGHVAPRPHRRAIDARDLAGPDACGRSCETPSARVAQLEHALAAQQHHRPPTGQLGDVARRARRRRQLPDSGRAAAQQGRRRGREQEDGDRKARA